MSNVYDYRDAGYHLFPLHGVTNNKCDCGDPECKALYKHPSLAAWQHTPLWSDEQWNTMLELGQMQSGFGVLVKDIIVIDVDARNGGVESYAKLCEDLQIDLLEACGFVVETGSGGGSMHLYFKAPIPPVALMQAHPSYKGIDFKNSGYVVAAGSMHASGRPYETLKGYPDELTDAPEGLVKLLERRQHFRAKNDGVYVDVSMRELSELMEKMGDPDETREKWIRVGMALHDTTTGSQDALELWDIWSQSGAKYKTGECVEKWHGFGKNPTVVASYGTLLYYAKENGYIQSVTFDGSGFVDDTIEEDILNTDHIDIRKPHGFAGDLCEWINGQCLYPRENLAAAATLYVLSCAGGLRHHDKVNGMTANFIAFCVAGSGCHAYGHPILMADGSIKPVQDITPGEYLMGQDGKPRLVNSLARGKEQLVEIFPFKGESFIVNINHILHLIRTGGEERLNITVKDWIESSKKFKAKWKLVRHGVDFEKAEQPIDPYVIGIMLGDGCLVGEVKITSMDQCIHNSFIAEMLKFDDIRIVKTLNAGENKSWHTFAKQKEQWKRSGSSVRKIFEDMGLYNVGAGGKFIPKNYLIADREQRLKLLAGIIDTDGSCNGGGGFDYITKSERLADDIVYLCRSLEIAAYKSVSIKSSQTGYTGTYYRVSISGDCSIVPVQIEHKKRSPRRQVKRVNVTGFNYKMLSNGDFYGFNISGDHLYLDGRFMVHHNTGKESIFESIGKIFKSIGLMPATHGKFKSEQEAMRNLVRHQASFYLVDELGIELAKVKSAIKRGGASYLEGLLGFIMSAYSKAKGTLIVSGDMKVELKKEIKEELNRIKKILDAKGEKGNEELLRDEERLLMDLKKADDGIEHPYLSMFGLTTGATFDSLIDQEMATNGFVARSAIFREHETNPKRKKNFKPMPMPVHVQSVLSGLFLGGHSRAPSRRVERFTDIEYIDSTSDAIEALDAVYEYFHDMAERNKSTTGLEAIPRRGWEICSKISLILAMPAGIRTKQDVLYGFAVAKSDIEQKIKLAYANSNEDNKERNGTALIMKIESKLDRESPTTLGQIKQSIRNFSSEQIDEALEQMLQAKKIRVEEKTAKNHKVSKCYFLT